MTVVAIVVIVTSFRQKKFDTSTTDEISSGLLFVIRAMFVWKWSKIAAQKKIFFADFALVHLPMALVLLSAPVERCFVSRMRDFFFKIS